MRKIGQVGVAAEKQFAKRVGGVQTPASGAMGGAKADVRCGAHLVEVKSTQSESLSVKLSWLLKIRQEALEQEKTPALAINFTDGTGRPVRNGAWVMIPESEWLGYVESNKC